MDSNVAAMAATPDTLSGEQRYATPPVRVHRNAEPAAEDAADYRLVIDVDKASGSYVYKTINRVTGEVVAQLPREEVLKLRENQDYQAGALIKASA